MVALPAGGAGHEVACDSQHQQSALGTARRSENGGSSEQGQVELISDVNANQWFVITAERIPGKSYR